MMPSEKKQTNDPRVLYADIIDLPHHRSAKHAPMSLYDRAAQFSPFAALTGYEDMIEEEASRTYAHITEAPPKKSRFP